MIAWAAPVAVGLASAAVGAGVDAPLRLVPRGAARAPLLALMVLVGAYVACIAPALAAAFVVLAVLTRSRRSPGSAPRPSAAFMAIAAAAVLLVFSRPAYVALWDGLVWLAKSRVGAPWPLALVDRALDPRGLVIPSGYPLFFSLAAAWLGGFSPAGRAVTAGAAGFDAIVLLVFLGALWDAQPGRRVTRLVVVTAILAICPLALVHLRAAYVDLPLGLLATSLALSLGSRRPAAAPALLAIALVGSKDEGLAHAVAVIAVAVAHSPRARKRAPLVALSCGAAAFLAWRWRLTHAGVPLEHPLTWPQPGRLAGLGAGALGAFRDRASWGATFGIGLGACAASLSRRSPLSRRLAATLLAQAAALAFALLAGPDRVMQFAANGTLIPRLLMQLVPTLAALVASLV